MIRETWVLRKINYHSQCISDIAVTEEYVNSADIPCTAIHNNNGFENGSSDERNYSVVLVTNLF